MVTRVNRCTERSARHVTYEQWKTILIEASGFFWLVWLKSFQDDKSEEKLWRSQQGHLWEENKYLKCTGRSIQFRWLRIHITGALKGLAAKTAEWRQDPCWRVYSFPQDWLCPGHKPSDIMVQLFATFNIPSPILTSTLNLFSALYYFDTNCTIILQLL